MAQTLSAGASALVTSDIFVNIEPNFICRYYGTSAQLVAEGLIPADFQWPLRNRRVFFEDDRFTYWVERNRVPGTKGPISGWIDGDYWLLDVSPKGQRHDWQTREIQIKQRELADLKKHGSPEWQKSWSGAFAAKQDTKYMAFRTQLFGEMTPRKRGRPVKSNQTTIFTQSQGATA